MPPGSRRSSGAEASIPRSGALPSCCTGSGTTPTNAIVWSQRSSIATWLPRCCAASRIQRTSRGASARWGTSGSGTRRLVGCRRRRSWSRSIHCCAGFAPSWKGSITHPTTSPDSSRPSGPRDSGSARVFRFPWERSTRIGMRSARGSRRAMSSMWWARPPASWPSRKPLTAYPGYAAWSTDPSIPTTWVSKRGSPLADISLSRWRPAPVAPWRNSRPGSITIGPAKPASFASHGTMATAPFW